MTGRPSNPPGRPPPALDREARHRQEYADPAGTMPPQYHVPEILMAGILVVLGGPVAHRVAPHDDRLAVGSLLLLTAGFLMALYAVVQLLRGPA